MAEQQGGLTPLGKAVVALLVLGMLGAGAWFVMKGGQPAGGPVAANQPAASADQPGTPGQPGAAGEAVDLTGVTTAKEYKFVPQDKLPPVKGVSSYKWDPKDKVVQFPINMWIGWLPIVAANHGFKANTESLFFKKYGFKVNLKLIDDPVAARDAYAAGESHILWGTLDMIALFAPDLLKDSRTAPRVFQQIDWSNGGDGIVVRDEIKSVKDLRGKTIVYAQNSPSQYYINALLITAGVQPGEVKHKYTATAFEAAAAFVADRKIDACVSWAPDIYNIPEKVKGTRILSTTADANKLITDVWAARADFSRDHPAIIEGLVAGIFEGMAIVRQDPTQAIKWMADGYGMPAEEVKGMLQDAHSTNFAENKEFFLDPANPTNFERTWKAITFVYRELGLIGSPVPFDQVMDFSVIKALDKKGLFKDSKNEYATTFVPQSFTKITAEAPILTQTLRINFYPNSYNLYEPAYDDVGRPIKNQLYDPNVEFTLERAGVLSGQFDAAVIAITGHTDSSMRGNVPREMLQLLSDRRASAVRDALIKRYKFPENKFVVKGLAWDQPADADDPDNHFKNRRVEISVYPMEAQ